MNSRGVGTGCQNQCTSVTARGVASGQGQDQWHLHKTQNLFGLLFGALRSWSTCLGDLREFVLSTVILAPGACRTQGMASPR